MIEPPFRRATRDDAKTLAELIDLASEGAGAALWGSGFMPSTYRGVSFRNSGDPILHLSRPPGVSASTQRARLDVLRDLNQLHQQSTGDAEIAFGASPVEELESLAPVETIAGYWRSVGVTWGIGTRLA